jgi:hypothetical protein
VIFARFVASVRCEAIHEDNRPFEALGAVNSREHDVFRIYGGRTGVIELVIIGFVGTIEESEKASEAV